MHKYERTYFSVQREENNVIQRNLKLFINFSL